MHFSASCYLYYDFSSLPVINDLIWVAIHPNGSDDCPQKLGDLGNVGLCVYPIGNRSSKVCRDCRTDLGETRSLLRDPKIARSARWCPGKGPITRSDASRRSSGPSDCRHS